MTATPQNLLRKGSDWLADQFKRNASSPVLYARGSANVTVQAVIGRTDWAVDTGTGPVINEVSRDFIVQAADLVLPALGQVTPLRGDKISDDGLVYEVLAPAGQQVWRWSDQFGKAYRIHTKKVPA